MGERETHQMFTPTLNMPNYSLHHWRMRGRVVTQTLGIEEFPVTHFVWVSGRLESVPPPALIDRVDTLLRAGADVIQPLGWREPLEIYQRNCPASATAAENTDG